MPDQPRPRPPFAPAHAQPPTPNEHPLRSGAATAGPPQILWPDIIGTSAGVSSKDATHFPTRIDVQTRHDACSHLRDRLKDGEIPDNVMRLVAFEEAIVGATRRLLVLDPHFDEVGVHALRGALNVSQAREVRLLTGQTAGGTTRWREDLEHRINADRIIDRGKVEVQWRTLRRRSFPFLHDRFAVVDDALWHFGATVGGGHEGVNAASGPWSAVDAGAVEFFDECWRDLR